MKQQHIEAVRFICAYKLADKIQPVDLLRQHMEKVKSVTKRFVCKKKSIEQKVIFPFSNSISLTYQSSYSCIVVIC